MIYKVKCFDCKKDFEYFNARLIDVAKYEILCEECKEIHHKRWVKALGEAWKKNHSKDGKNEK